MFTVRKTAIDSSGDACVCGSVKVLHVPMSAVVIVSAWWHAVRYEIVIKNTTQMESS